MFVTRWHCLRTAGVASRHVIVVFSEKIRFSLKGLWYFCNNICLYFIISSEDLYHAIYI